jgi:outer membrane lipoprotein carrier protein
MKPVSPPRSGRLTSRLLWSRRAALCAIALPWVAPAQAQAPAPVDPLQALRTFVREAASGRAAFTQTVTSPDGQRRRVSSGTLEFQRPGRFRFQYAKPFEQLIVADGTRVWIHDPELSQATSRPLAQALGQTPAAILAGGSLERDFELSALPAEGGLGWVQALPRDKDGPIQSLRVGFRGLELAVLELRDSFGQRSRLELRDLRLNVPVAPAAFRFTPPPGTDVIEQ